MKKNCNQAEYRKDTCIMMKNFRVALACIFIFVFSLVGILNSFASSPTPESSSSSSSSYSSDGLSDLTGLGSSDPGSDYSSSDDTSSVTVDSSSSGDSASSADESPSATSAK